MDTSILRSTKKILGISLNDSSFDLDAMMHINTAFSILHQMGVGPAAGFSIDGPEDTWDDFIAGLPEFAPYLGTIKICVFLRVRLGFDPPQTSYHLAALERQLEEHEVRLSWARENAQWFEPVEERPVVIDAGSV